MHVRWPIVLRGAKDDEDIRGDNESGIALYRARDCLRRRCRRASEHIALGHRLYTLTYAENAFRHGEPVGAGGIHFTQIIEKGRTIERSLTY